VSFRVFSVADFCGCGSAALGSSVTINNRLCNAAASGGLALDCAPWHNDALMISLLTDRDSFHELYEVAIWLRRLRATQVMPLSRRHAMMSQRERRLFRRAGA